MNFHRGKIAEVTVGPRWRVKHHAAAQRVSSGLYDIVGAEDEADAIEQVNAAYPKRRIIISVELLDD